MSVTSKNMTYALMRTAAVGMAGYAIGASIGALTASATMTAITTSALFGGTLALWYCIRAVGERKKIAEWKVAAVTGVSLVIPLMTTHSLYNSGVASLAACTACTPFVMAAAKISLVALTLYFGALGAATITSLIVAAVNRRDKDYTPMKNALPKSFCSSYRTFVFPWRIKA